MNPPIAPSPAWDRLRRHFLAAWPTAMIRSPERTRHSEVGCLVGLSGGADSVSLACLLAEYWQTLASDGQPRRPIPPLVLAHYNHGLRGTDSDEDERFAIALAAQLDLPILVGRADAASSADEASLRGQRYEFLSRAAAQSGCRVIALAHTADDQVETVLHHLFRGTGVAGLAGIRSGRGLDQDWVIRRPLLACRSDWIREALRSIGQKWREDGSNQDTQYTRNWLRHELIPLIRQRYPSATEAILRAAAHQAEADDFLRAVADDWIEHRVTLINNDQFEICCQNNSPSPHDHRALVVRAFQTLFDRLNWPRQSMSQNHWTRLAELVVAPGPPNEHARPDKHWPGGIQAEVIPHGNSENGDYTIRLRRTE